MTMQGEVIPFRRKQRVLCVFDAIHRRNGSTETIQDSEMVTVEYSDEVENELLLAIRRRPDRPIDVRLKSYLPESGSALPDRPDPSAPQPERLPRQQLESESDRLKAAARAAFRYRNIPPHVCYCERVGECKPCRDAGEELDRALKHVGHTKATISNA